MTNKYQIEEMAKDIEQARIKAADTTNSMNYGFGGWYAKELYNAGYRKASEVAREISKDIIEPIWRAYRNSESKETVLLVALICEVINAELKKKYTEDTE